MIADWDGVSSLCMAMAIGITIYTVSSVCILMCSVWPYNMYCAPRVVLLLVSLFSFLIYFRYYFGMASVCLKDSQCKLLGYDCFVRCVERFFIFKIMTFWQSVHRMLRTTERRPIFQRFISNESILDLFRHLILTQFDSIHSCDRGQTANIVWISWVILLRSSKSGIVRHVVVVDADIYYF